MARSPAGRSLRKLGDPTFLMPPGRVLSVIRSPGRVAAAPIAPSARIFTRRATTVLQTSLLTQGQHCRLRPACFPPRVVHRARSRLHSRPHTCVLSRETRRDARQYASGRGGRREGAHFALAFARAWAAAGRCGSVSLPQRSANGVGGGATHGRGGREGQREGRPESAGSAGC